jgi:hypothetical protein
VTLLAEEGVPRHVIKAFAHHADIKVTEKSLHAQPGPYGRGCAEALRRAKWLI